MDKKALIYEGKAKRLYTTEQPDVVWVEYTNQATAFNGGKKDQFVGKGALNNAISMRIFQYLTAEGIENHFIEQLSDTVQLNRKVEIIPVEVVVRNVVAGSFAKKFGLAEGAELASPVVEFYYKSDELGDPFMNQDQVVALKIASYKEIAYLKTEALKINRLLQTFWEHAGLTLVDFKIEFGRTNDGRIILADEISPDSMRLWDAEGHHMDKDVYRRGLGDLVDTYQKVLDALETV